MDFPTIQVYWLLFFYAESIGAEQPSAEIWRMVYEVWSER